MELLFIIIDAFGVINTCMLIVWAAFFISLVGIIINNKIFFSECTFGRAQIHSYERGYEEGSWDMYVKLLDVKGKPVYRARFSGGKEGSVIDVAYRKRSDKYEIWPADRHWNERLFFVLQLIPLLVIAGLWFYSHVIEPGAYIL